MLWYVQRQVVPFLREPGRLHVNDFKHIYLGAVFLSEGHNPYDAEEFLAAARAFQFTEDPRFRSILPYVYLPFTGVVLIPLTWFPFSVAAWIWFWVNHLLFLLGGWLASRAVGLPRRSWILVLVLLFLAWNQPAYRTLSAGQLNGVLLFGFALILWMAPRAPAWATGVVAAFAALFKLTPAILFFWFLAERKWRQAAWMAAACALFTAATLPLTGVRTWLDFLPVLRDMGYGKSTWSEQALGGQRFYRDPYNQSLNSFYHHAFASEPGGDIRPWASLGPGWSNGFTIADTLALIGATGWLVWPRRRRRNGSRNARIPEGDSPHGAEAAPASVVESVPPLPVVLRYALLVVLSLLIPSICWDHYLILLVLPFLALARLLLEWRAGPLILTLFAVAVIATGAPIPFDAPAFRAGIGLLGMSAKLWSTVLVWFLLAWAVVRYGEWDERRDRAGGLTEV